MAGNAGGLGDRASARLALEGVSKSYRIRGETVRALDDVTVRVAEGEFVCLLGPSGCGKSTLLNLVAGFETADRGAVLAHGRPVRGPGPDRMLLFQEPALFPWLDVLGNVRFGLGLAGGISGESRTSVARQHLRLLGLEGFLHARVHQLSGGMRQRVALARALAPNPEVLLMDEPFASLDALTRERLYGDLQRIGRGRTTLFVTHNVREAVCLGDRVVLLSPRPGRIVREFSIGLPRPRDMNSVGLAAYASEIGAALRGEARPSSLGISA
ncbi:MAG: ABC transporter ATP-binding protein [Planctomycetes bacterium]|nr:ABC transporter ATP-binding protein [Planctomycetota bacterium]